MCKGGRPQGQLGSLKLKITSAELPVDQEAEWGSALPPDPVSSAVSQCVYVCEWVNQHMKADVCCEALRVESTAHLECVQQGDRNLQVVAWLL